MNDTTVNRFTTGIVLVVLVGFWLALSPSLPGVQGPSRAWKPVAMAPAFGPVPASAPRPAQEVTVPAVNGPRASVNLAKATLPSDPSQFNR